MTEVEELEEESGAEALVQALVDGQVITILVHNLHRLDETQKPEADGVHNTLGILLTKVLLYTHCLKPFA